VPGDLRAIIDHHTRFWPDGPVHVGCSGIFTIERILAPAQRFEIHSNDVQILSCTIGGYLAGSPPTIKVSPKYHRAWGWLDMYLVDPAERTATVMLASEMLVGVNRDNAYYARQRQGYRDQWERLHAQTTARVKAVKLRLASFYPGDVVPFVEAAGPSPVACFPPFFAGDYEHQFADVARVLEWPEPSYPVLDADRLELLIDRIVDREHWIFGTNVRRERLEPHLRGVVQTTNRGVAIWVYSSEAPSACVVPRQELEPVLVPRLVPGGALSGPLRVHLLSQEQFQALRSQYMNRGIIPGQPSICCAVTAGGRLVGSFAYSLAPSAAHWGQKLPEPHAYLLSDFPVAPVDYRHLAKLVLTAALSNETRRIVERYASRRMRSVVTTAYSEHPASMKYRGMFRLLKRDESDGSAGGYYGQRYTLHYGIEWPGWTLAEGFETWQKTRAQLRD
jgi:hypothetical protein